MKRMSGWKAWAAAGLAAAAVATAGPAVRAAGAADEDMVLLRRTSKAFAAVAKRAVPAVVSIRVEKTFDTGMGGRPQQFNDPFDFFGDEFLRRFLPERRFEAPRRFTQVGQGSGFLISKDGYILTNNHVVGDADKIRVRLHDGREFDAKRIGSDPKTEVAVIKIEGDSLAYLRKGDSAALEIGEWVIAVGNPFGLGESVTVGVVSAKGRASLDIGDVDYQDFIQTDAAINPGNSGGPLLNIAGEVVGINTAIYSQNGGYQGIGFAIPFNLADAIREQLVRTGKVVRGYLGIHIQEITRDLAESMGLKSRSGILVADVAQGSPADKAGLRQEDVILKLNGGEVVSVNSFRNDISGARPGTEVTLTIRREDRVWEVKARTGSLPGSADTAAISSPGEEKDLSEVLGLNVAELTRADADKHGYGINDGVLVSAVEPGGAAALAGIRPGNLISNVNRKHVASVAEFMAALQRSQGAGKPVLLQIKDGKFSRYLAVKVK